jgi:hypothetical protein
LNIHIFVVSINGVISFRADSSSVGANIRIESPLSFLRRIASFPVKTSLIVKSKRVDSRRIVPLEELQSGDGTAETSISGTSATKLTATDDAAYWLGCPCGSSVFHILPRHPVSQGGGKLSIKYDLSDSALTYWEVWSNYINSGSNRPIFMLPAEIYENGGTRGVWMKDRIPNGASASALFQYWNDDRSDSPQ